jgi:glycosyltransferase involved in cell wall biosynthesis
MLHDLTPRTHPDRHTLANRFCFNAYLETSLDEAAVVVAGSRATADEALAHFPWLAAKLERIGYGVDHAFQPPAADDDGAATRVRFAGGEPYVLHLGTLEPRKGLLQLIAAWEELARRLPRSPALVLAGAPGWGGDRLARRLAASPFRHRIHLPGYVPAAAAVALLQHAAVFVLASEVEGWGLPLAEALACGTVAVASAIPSLAECGGDAALYAPPGDVAALSAAIAAALEPERAAALRARARARAPLLRWPPVVSAWCELVERVRSRRGRRPGASATGS